MQTEIDILKKRISELESENAKLQQLIEENAECDVKYSTLNARIEELESELAKFKRNTEGGQKYPRFF